jgi:hypothetical protein
MDGYAVSRQSPQLYEIICLETGQLKHYFSRGDGRKTPFISIGKVAVIENVEC